MVAIAAMREIIIFVEQIYNMISTDLSQWKKQYNYR